MKFQDEGTKLRKRYGEMQVSSRDSSRSLTPSESDRSATSTPISQGKSSEQTLEIQRPSSSISPFHFTTVASPNLAQTQLLSCFSISAFPPSDLAPEMRFHTNWLGYVSQYMGNGKAIDWALRAVACSHFGRQRRDDSMIVYGQQTYTQALRCLHEAIRDPARSHTSDTISATMLLSFYELVSCTEKNSWIKHAGGAGQLIQARGPKSFLHGFDRAIFLVFRASIIIEAYESGKECFLDTPEWHELSRNIHEDLGHRNVTIRHAEPFFRVLVAGPGLLKESREVEVHLATGRTDLVGPVKARAHDHRSKLQKGYAALYGALTDTGQAPTEVASATADPIFPTVLDFPNMFVSSIITSYYNCLLVTNLIMIDLDESNEAVYRAENILCAREICKSVEYMATSSFIGPFFMIFALRLAFMVIDGQEEKIWIKEWLDRLGESVSVAKVLVDPRESRIMEDEAGWDLWEKLR